MLERTLYGNIIDGGIVSSELEGTMNALNKTQLVKAAGEFDGKYCYWALPSGSNTTNTIVIQLWHDKLYQTAQGPMRSWVRHSSGYTVDNFFISTISGRAKLYWSDTSTSGKVFLIDSSIYTDNGTIITSEVRPRDYMGDPIRKTKWRYNVVKYDTGSAGTLQVNAKIDQATTYANERNISLTGSSPGLGSFILGTSLLGGAATSRNFVNLQQLTGTLLGLQLIEATNNPLTLYDFQVLGNRKGMRTNL
jgi:hypothetical protein